MPQRSLSPRKSPARRAAAAAVSAASLGALLFGGITPALAATADVNFTDTFSRSIASGWGSSDSGIAWKTPAGTSRVNGSSGNLDMKPGQGFSNSLLNFTSRTGDLQVNFSLSKLPVNGDMYVYVTPRKIDANEYRVKVKISPDGATRLDLTRMVNGAETTLKSFPAGKIAKSGGTLNVGTSVSGGSSTTFAAKIWASGTPVPGFQATAQDNHAALQKPGTVALGAYLGTGASAPVTVRWDNLKVKGSKDSAAQAPAAPGVTVPKPPADVAPKPPVTSSSALDARNKLVYGQYKPDAATTGVIPGTALKPYNTSSADLVITQDGTVLDGLEIWGDIKVRAANVTIKNSRLHGGKVTPKSSTGIIDSNDARVKNLVVQDNTIIPQFPSYYRDGIIGHDYTALRNHITKTSDGLGIFNRPGGPAAANVTAKGNYIHTLTFFTKDPAHSDGTHNDGIQIQGGENILISGNQINGNVVAGAGSAGPARGLYGTTAMLLQQNVAKLKNVVVENNYIDSGFTSVTIDSTSHKQASIEVTFRNNYLGHNQYAWDGAKYQIRIMNRAASHVTGLGTNKWADSLALLTEGSNKGIHYQNK